jgi:hypothetical protein
MLAVWVALDTSWLLSVIRVDCCVTALVVPRLVEAVVVNELSCTISVRFTWGVADTVAAGVAVLSTAAAVETTLLVSLDGAVEVVV